MDITWSLLTCIGTICWCLFCCCAIICCCFWSFCSCCCLIASCCCNLCCFNTCSAKASCWSFNCCFCFASWCISCCCLSKSCCVADNEGAGTVRRAVEFCCTTNFWRSGCWAIGRVAPAGKGLKGGTTCRVFCLTSSRLVAWEELSRVSN